MHAVVMHQYGPPEVLTFAKVSLPALGPDGVWIKSIASAINHTDLEIRAGSWTIKKPHPFPYVPGVEVVGEIEEVAVRVASCDRTIGAPACPWPAHFGCILTNT
jgi:NADPH2:quinone reductase